jgi:hypothetical protein
MMMRVSNDIVFVEVKLCGWKQTFSFFLFR